MAWVSCTFEGSGIYGQSTNSLIIKLSKIPGKYTYPAEVKEDADEEEEAFLQTSVEPIVQEPQDEPPLCPTTAAVHLMELANGVSPARAVSAPSMVEEPEELEDLEELEELEEHRQWN